MLQARAVSPSTSSSLSGQFKGRTPQRRTMHTIVSFDLTLPGQTSYVPRQRLMHALGESTRVQHVSTDRRTHCITLHVEVPDGVFDNVLNVVATSFANATLGHATTIYIRR
jgi:hypothetical protein